jgi:hypothetical protein
MKETGAIHDRKLLHWPDMLLSLPEAGFSVPSRTFPHMQQNDKLQIPEIDGSSFRR